MLSISIAADGSIAAALRASGSIEFIDVDILRIVKVGFVLLIEICGTSPPVMSNATVAQRLTPLCFICIIQGMAHVILKCAVYPVCGI